MVISTNEQKLKGVNLGGWLVLEKWITPSLFENTNAVDEFNLHKKQLKNKIKAHYKNFIKENDFKFLSDHGINAVRIPVGYWLFGDFPSFPKTVTYLDFSFENARKYNLKVLIDLHSGPGSQNGYDHSGIAGEVNWHKDPKNISKTLEIIEKISTRYCKSKCLYGISLLNEPSKDIPIDILEDFYVKGYKIVRKYCDEKVRVIISDSFRPLKFSKIMCGSEFINVILDSHFYQCFYEDNKKISIDKIIKNTESEWTKIIKKVQKSKPIICGEWSLGIDPMSVSHLSQELEISAIKRYGQTQMDIFDKTEGWFFWTYKTESNDGWNFRSSLEDGTLYIKDNVVRF